MIMPNLKGTTTLFYGNIYSKILYVKEGAPQGKFSLSCAFMIKK
jgi:hypothetical protein